MNKARTMNTPPKKTPTPTHPPVAKMVTLALQSLNERGGSSLKAVKKFIQENFEVLDMKRLSPHINKCIKKGLDTGTFIQSTGKGINGSFKLPKETKKAATKTSSEAAETGEETKKVTGKKPGATAIKITVPKKKSTATAPAAAGSQKTATKGKSAKKTPEKEQDNEGDSTLPIEGSQESTQSTEDDSDAGRLPDLVARPLPDTKATAAQDAAGQIEAEISDSDSQDQEEDEDGVIEVRPKKKGVARKPAAKKAQPKKPAAKASKGVAKKAEPPSPELSDDSEEEAEEEEEAPAAKKPATAAKAKKAPPKKKAPAPKKKATGAAK